jgi:hypothetical protein
MVLWLSFGGITSGSSCFNLIKRTSSDSAGLPLMITGAPASRIAKACSSMSSRNGSLSGLRVPASGPWQW